MKVLIACEYSGITRDAFIRRGHDAISCDLLDTESPGPHYKGDVKDILYEDWDLIIAHPPCTMLAVSGAQWYYHPEDKHLPVDKRRPHPKYPNRLQDKQEGVNFFLLFTDLKCPRVCIENPVGCMSKIYRKPDQIIQPYQFGHKEAKKTCLWLKGLPKLIPTKIVEPEYVIHGGKKIPKWYSNAKGDRRKERSKSFVGISEAMAHQFGQ